MSSEQGKSVELVWHGGQVQTDERYQLLNQYPITLWLTGLSASGKSTLAFALERHLIDIGHACYVLDGDNVRHGLNKNLGFSPEDRTENIRRIAEVAHLMNDAGLIVITAFISPARDDRKLAQQIIGKEHFVEIYINTPIQVCEARDPKGMYKRARAGELSDFTGIHAPYEPPISPSFIIDTATANLTECVNKLSSELISKITIPKNFKKLRISNEQ